MSSPPTISPAPASFIPRKEFIKKTRPTRSSFSLLAISGPNCVRLYSFTAQAVQIIRRVLEQHAPILAVREDSEHNLCEFSLDKKPWGNPKSVPSEKLLVDILAGIYYSGYIFLSTLDYGREADDRLILVFSKQEPVAPPSSRTATPQSPPRLLARDESSSSTLDEKPPDRRVPFAISFASATTMRVISPPLHLTPAILQACRGAWPRGVVSERTVYENSYEFKLKGYGLFQQDTFATDSLRHILTLLSSLDGQSFSLVASISLTNRSRIKDLWVFTGPAPDDIPADPLETSTLESSALRRFSFPPGNVDPQNRTLATQPPLAAPHPPFLGHNRSSSEDTKRRPSPNGQQSNVLRKGAPRAQVPVDIRASEYLEQGPSNRPHVPSTVPEGVANMTGVGSGQIPNILYETSAFGTSPREQDLTLPGPVPLSPTPRRPSSLGPSRSPARSVAGRVKTPPLLLSSSPPRRESPASSRNSKPTTPVAELHPSVPLLASGVFRDSSMTSDTDITREIPIKWTGPLNNDSITAKDESSKQRPESSSSPVIPGSWQRTPSPIAEKAEDFRSDSTERQQQSVTPIHENDSRVEAPEVVQPDMELRKSEAALVGMIKATESPPPPVPTTHRKDTSTGTGNGQGWVMVNVENSQSSTSQLGNETKSVSRHTAVASGSQTSVSTSEDQLRPQQASPEAKAIVVIDVLNSKNQKKRSASSSKDSESGMRRLFSLTRKNSSVSLFFDVWKRADEHKKSKVDGEKDSNKRS